MLRDTYGLKWSEIIEIPKFASIPLRTLSMIYLGKRGVPKKYREQLGEPIIIPTVACSACGKVHSYDRACEMRVILKPKVRRKPRIYRDLYDWPVHLLRSAIENREEV